MSVASVTVQPAIPASPAAALPIVMIAGYFGAGKSSLARRLAQELAGRGTAVEFGADDASSDPVDTAILQAEGFEPVRISGLTELKNGATLITMVSRPRSIPSSAAAPLSVVVDAARAARVLKIEPGRSFSENAWKACQRQLSEADIILLNKIDLVSPAGLKSLRRRLATDFPAALVFDVSARTGAGLDGWFRALQEGQTRSAGRPAPGEDSIPTGYLSYFCSVMQISSVRGFACNPILARLGQSIREELSARRIEIAHLKMAFKPEVDVEGVATLNLAGNDGEIDLGGELAEPVERGSLHIHLRAEGRPDHLHAGAAIGMTHTWTAFPGLLVRVTSMENCEAAAEKIG